MTMTNGGVGNPTTGEGGGQDDDEKGQDKKQEEMEEGKTMGNDQAALLTFF